MDGVVVNQLAPRVAEEPALRMEARSIAEVALDEVQALALDGLGVAQHEPRHSDEQDQEYGEDEQSDAHCWCLAVR